MDQQFDTLVKLSSAWGSRRRLIAALLSLIASRGALSTGIAQPGCRTEGHSCEGNQTCCEGLVCAETGKGSASRCIAEQRPAVPVPTVSTVLPYRVDVTCDYEAAQNQTSCVFVGSGDADVPAVTAIVLPAESLCSEVVDGEFDIQRAPDGGGNSYHSNTLDQEGRPRCTIVFAGRVATASAASYWCETDGGTFPAEGAGLSCPQADASDQISETAGAVLVYSLLCPAADLGGDYDWYASCTSSPARSEFELRTTDSSMVSEVLTTSSSGPEPAKFLLLDAGSYTLNEIGANWCHAESDNTNDRGEVIVQAGQRTSVWIFHCPSESS